jgi:hypothetical protein
MLYWSSSALLTSSKLLYCCMHSKYDVTWVIHILRGSVVFYFCHLQIREQICKHKFIRWFINVNHLVIFAEGDGAGVLKSWISEFLLKPLSVAEIFMKERYDLAELEGTELFGLFRTLSIVLYLEDKIPQRFGDWICLRPQVDGAG